MCYLHSLFWLNPQSYPQQQYVAVTARGLERRKTKGRKREGKREHYSAQTVRLASCLNRCSTDWYSSIVLSLQIALLLYVLYKSRRYTTTVPCYPAQGFADLGAAVFPGWRLPRSIGLWGGCGGGRLCRVPASARRSVLGSWPAAGRLQIWATPSTGTAACVMQCQRKTTELGYRVCARENSTGCFTPPCWKA